MLGCRVLTYKQNKKWGFLMGVVISGTGLFTPPYSISNEELVNSFNAYVDHYNCENAAAIEAGEVEALQYSTVEFIEKASGIKSRHVMSKDTILDPEIMKPRIPLRANDEVSFLAEMAIKAGKDALQKAGREAGDVDAVIVACAGLQRPFPAMAVEVQEYLGIDGFAFDMNVACSSATFGIRTAADMITAGSARSILVVNPEFCTAHLNFRDRDSHFIFGDVATAVLVEDEDYSVSENAYRIIGTKLKTKFSNNIRNNFGFMNRVEDTEQTEADLLFKQEGRKVFREVCPMVAELILDHMQENQIRQQDIARLWLHQANIHMNTMIGAKVMGREPANDEAPVILDEYANTSSAGSIIAFNKYSDDLKSGDTGIICSFGAGYSVGSVIVRKV